MVYAGSASDSQQSQQVVVVWDLDETLIIFNSLINGSYAQSNANDSNPEAAVDSSKARSLGDRVADSIFQFLDVHLMFEKVEHLDPMHLSDMHVSTSSISAPNLHAYESHKQAAGNTLPAQDKVHHEAPNTTIQPTVGRQHSLKRSTTDTSCTEYGAVHCSGTDHSLQQQSSNPVHRHHADQPLCHGATFSADDAQAWKRARSSKCESEDTQTQIFTKIMRTYTSGMSALPLSESERSSLSKTCQAVDAMCDGWIHSAVTLLPAISAAAAAQGCTVHHCIVTTGQLVATLGKLLMFGLAPSIPADQVYSASKQSKLAAFKRIRQRWGVAAHYLAVGDGPEESRAASMMRWPFIQISLSENLSWPPRQVMQQIELTPLSRRSAAARSIQSHTLTSDDLTTVGPSKPLKPSVTTQHHHHATQAGDCITQQLESKPLSHSEELKAHDNSSQSHQPLAQLTGVQHVSDVSACHGRQPTVPTPAGITPENSGEAAAPGKNAVAKLPCSDLLAPVDMGESLVNLVARASATCQSLWPTFMSSQDITAIESTSDGTSARISTQVTSLSQDHSPVTTQYHRDANNKLSHSQQLEIHVNGISSHPLSHAPSFFDHQNSATPKNNPSCSQAVFQSDHPFIAHDAPHTKTECDVVDEVPDKVLSKQNESISISEAATRALAALAHTSGSDAACKQVHTMDANLEHYPAHGNAPAGASMLYPGFTETPKEGVRIQQLWPQLILDVALKGKPWEEPEEVC